LKTIKVIALFLILSSITCRAQAWFDDFTPPQPKTAKQNTSQLIGGLAMQVFGLGVLAGSAYVGVLEPELGEVSVYGMTLGAGFAFVGSGLMIRSIRNMVIVRRSIHDMKKEKRKNDVSLQFGPTQYGVGIVCIF
jgi:hypothetical protein